jgi:hypothetical protein
MLFQEACIDLWLLPPMSLFERQVAHAAPAAVTGTRPDPSLGSAWQDSATPALFRIIRDLAARAGNRVSHDLLASTANRDTYHGLPALLLGVIRTGGRG